MAHRWNKTKKKTVLRIRLGRDQARSRCLTAHSNRWKTGSDFAIRLISSPRWEQDTERKRRPSNDRVAGNKTEKKTVLSTPRGTRLRSAALQTIESAAESGFSRTFDDWRSYCKHHLARFSQLAPHARRPIFVPFRVFRGSRPESTRSLRRCWHAHAFVGDHRFDSPLPDLRCGVKPRSQPLSPRPC